jgi:Na+-driven multidrug efflux pump/anti-sigma regulatory factor (Ser/Thr protein kinase)
MGKEKRNSFIVSKALKTFVMAAVLTAAASQVAHTADSMIIGHVVGQDAVSAINLVLPLVEVLNCMAFLICFGANAMCAQAIGSNDLDKVARTFTSTLLTVMTLGLAVSLGIALFSDKIVTAISEEPRLNGMAYDYIHTYALGGWLQMLSYGMCLFVATDGRPRMVTLAVVGGAIVNALTDVVCIVILGMGVEGAALGSLSMFIVNILILAYYLHQPSSSYRLKWPGKDVFKIFFSQIKEGAPVTVSNSLMAVTILLINDIVLRYIGADGLFIWSVCLQMLLISYVFVDGVLESMFAIGGVLMGERDLRGLGILVRQALIVISTLVAFVIVLMYLPNVVGFLFGVQAGTPIAIELNRVLRIFALMLIPFSVSQVLLSAYQILGYEKTSVVTATAQTCLLVLGVWFVAELEGVELWWGFAASCALVLLFQLSYTTLRSRMSHEPISPLTMIPQQPKGYTFDHSVKYKLDDVYAALNDIDAFLKGAQVSNATRFDVNVCCEELMTNIAQHSHGRILKQTFDLHIHVNDEGVFVTMKDAGRPFDPIKTGKMADSHIGTEGHEHLGLRLVTNIIPDISYKYMYGQNTVFIWKKAKEKEDGVSR